MEEIEGYSCLESCEVFLAIVVDKLKEEVMEHEQEKESSARNTGPFNRHFCVRMFELRQDGSRSPRWRDIEHPRLA